MPAFPPDSPVYCFSKFMRIGENTIDSLIHILCIELRSDSVADSRFKTLSPNLDPCPPMVFGLSENPIRAPPNRFRTLRKSDPCPPQCFSDSPKIGSVPPPIRAKPQIRAPENGVRVPKSVPLDPLEKVSVPLNPCP